MNRTRRSAALISLAALLLLLPAAASGQRLAEAVREHTLANGMKLLMVERHASPTVAAWIRYRVGSVDERSDERGIAHLLEHMLFKGTRTIGTTDYEAEKPLLEQIEATARRLLAEQAKRHQGNPTLIARLERELAELEKTAAAYSVKDELAEIYARHGGSSLNAFTSKDGTAYLVSLPANKLELWAALEADRMRHPVLREFYAERSVVMEERRRSVETQPRGLLWESFLATAFWAHPYGQPIIGWMSDIEHLTRTKAEGFLKRYYAPANAVVAVVGDIDPPQVIALVERYFGGLAPGVPVPPVAVEEPPQRGERRIELRLDAEPQLMIGFHKPVYPDPAAAAFDVLAMVLADGTTSRLHRKLVIEQQIATSVAAFDAPGDRYPNLFVVAATPRSPHTAGEVEAAITAELERLKREPVTERELEQIRNRMAYDEVSQMASNGGLARLLTHYETVTGSWRDLDEQRRRIAAVTPADLMAAARDRFTTENRTVATISRKEVAR
jgi:predicted Zn-dependent peptidase